MADHAIEVEAASLVYRLSRNRSGSLKEFLIRLVKGQVEYEKLWALKEVSFQARQGELLGVIGPNGAGKSTLMKLLARVLPPTEGRVLVRGSVAPMINLGAGFNTELTGYENIVLNGTILGRSAKSMRERAGAIAEWAELTDFLDVPLRSYSSGMLARLGFAVALDTNPDILIVDEVFAVGDEAFQRKSIGRIKELIDEGVTVVLVSHGMSTILEYSDRVLWLDHGRVQKLGEPHEVVAAYQAAVASTQDADR